MHPFGVVNDFLFLQKYFFEYQTTSLLLDVSLWFDFTKFFRPISMQKLGLSGKRYATRCGLWWAEMLKAWGQYREAANVYFCISNEVTSRLNPKFSNVVKQQMR